MNRHFRLCLLIIVCSVSIVYTQKQENTDSLSLSTSDSLRLLIKMNNRTLEMLPFRLQQSFNEILSGIDYSTLQNRNGDSKKNPTEISEDMLEEIKNSIHSALIKTLPKAESQTIASARKYLSISKNVLAFILAMIHIAKFY